MRGQAYDLRQKRLRRVDESSDLRRVSTLDQEPENQLLELRRDELVRDAKRRKFDLLVCWRLDRLGRNLRHLILLLDDLQAVGIGFVTLGEGIDTTSPTGRLVLHVLGAIAEFERARVQERVRAGLARARAQGVRLGRPPRQIDPERLATVIGLPEREAARRLGCSPVHAATVAGPETSGNRMVIEAENTGRSEASRS